MNDARYVDDDNNDETFFFSHKNKNLISHDGFFITVPW